MCGCGCPGVCVCLEAPLTPASVLFGPCVAVLHCVLRYVRVVGGQDVLVNVKTTPVMPKYVLPVDLQGEWESRRYVTPAMARAQ
jgi:hypothetical protein